MKITVSSVSAAGADEILVGVEISNGVERQSEKLLLPTDVYTELGVTKGECDSSLYERLEEEARIYAAYKRGLYILGYGGCSVRALVAKLVTKGFDKEYAQSAAERLCKNGLLCERSNARREAERCAAKLWGQIRISAHLRSKGYGDGAVKDAIFALEDGGVDFEGNCVRLVDCKCKGSRLPSDRVELQRLISSVMRYGYSVGEVKHALSQIANRKSSIYD